MPTQMRTLVSWSTVAPLATQWTLMRPRRKTSLRKTQRRGLLALGSPVRAVYVGRGRHRCALVVGVQVRSGQRAAMPTPMPPISCTFVLLALPTSVLSFYLMLFLLLHMCTDRGFVSVPRASTDWARLDRFCSPPCPVFFFLKAIKTGVLLENQQARKPAVAH